MEIFLVIVNIILAIWSFCNGWKEAKKAGIHVTETLGFLYFILALMFLVITILSVPGIYEKVFQPK